MLSFKHISLLITSILALGLFLGASPANAAGLSVDPSYGNYNMTFSVSAKGFNKNENVALWVGLSNGLTVGLGTTQADGSGRISFTISPQSSWSQGQVTVVAHGMSSQLEVSGSFTLAKDTSETTTTSVPAKSGGIVAYSVEGLTVNYVGSGYTPNERVSAWFQYPSESGTSTAHALPDVYADSSGNVTFTFTISKDWEYGNYHITAEGAQSKHVTFNTFSYFGTITEQRAYLTGTSGTSSGTVSSGIWYGYYYANTDLSGSPVYTQSYSTLDFNWGTGSPAPSVPVDNFSARWVTTRTFNAGYYTLTATADDGIRVYVDGTLVIDEWQDQPATTYTSTLYLGSGNHTITVEYYEHTLYAVAAVQITAD
jgi:hypothetical protein